MRPSRFREQELRVEAERVVKYRGTTRVRLEALQFSMERAKRFQSEREQERLERERLEQERLEQERLEQERLERLEQERLEQERLKLEKLEKLKKLQESFVQKLREQEKLD